jgi:hypothetical protein
MKSTKLSWHQPLLATVLALGLHAQCEGGWPFHRHRGDCDCAAPVVHVAPVADCGCACAASLAPCCGIGGGMTQLGNMYGLGVHGGVATDSGSAIHDGVIHDGASHHGFSAGSTFHGSASGLTGYEGLPDMDGGGVNHRYPYHSYRRPWAHPGPRSSNVSIVW